VNLAYARPVPGVVVIPVKSFTLGKGRLASALDPEARARLGKGLAEHVASTVAESGEMPLVVTSDPDVAEWATRSGFPALADPGDGLDVAARTGMEWAQQSDSFWLILHSDLPLLHSSDVAALTRPLEAGQDVIAPSADGGTSAIGSGEAVDFAFGSASFHHHLQELRNPHVAVRRGLLLDIDSPGDLAAATTTQRGRWLGDIISGP
jgi:2-phospho-L-lactate guanylyltransferase